VKDWNAVISVYQDGFRRALRALKECGAVDRSPYHNVLLMRVDAPSALLEAIEQKTKMNTALHYRPWLEQLVDLGTRQYPHFIGPAFARAEFIGETGAMLRIPPSEFPVLFSGQPLGLIGDAQQ
jgi:hypothetical protein